MSCPGEYGVMISNLKNADREVMKEKAISLYSKENGKVRDRSKGGKRSHFPHPI